MLNSILGRTRTTHATRGWRAKLASSNRFRNITIVLSVAGLLAASELSGDIAALAFFTFIGIPIAIILTLLPTIALATVIAFLLSRLIPASDPVRISLGYACAIAIMLAIPPLHNVEVESALAKLTSQDVVSSNGDVPQISKEAVIGLPGTDRSSRRCGFGCMHLLISRQATAVIAARTDAEEVLPDFRADGYRYWLARRSECDLTIAIAYNADFKERRADTIAGAYGRMVDTGMCIVREEASLSAAGVVISSRRWQKFPQPWTFSPIASGIRASRSAIYERGENGAWQAVWQKTPIEYSLLKPILAHSWRQNGYSFEAEWWRTHFRAEPHLNLLKLLSAAGYRMPERWR